MKHTPGPWKVNDESNGFLVAQCGNSSEDGEDYAVFGNGHATRDGYGEPDAKNDAYLIAAAPDMYWTLRAIIDAFGINPFMKARRDMSAEELNNLIKHAVEVTLKAEGKR